MSKAQPQSICYSIDYKWAAQIYPLCTETALHYTGTLSAEKQHSALDAPLLQHLDWTFELPQGQSCGSSRMQSSVMQDESKVTERTIMYINKKNISFMVEKLSLRASC